MKTNRHWWAGLVGTTLAFGCGGEIGGQGESDQGNSEQVQQALTEEQFLAPGQKVPPGMEAPLPPRPREPSHVIVHRGTGIKNLAETDPSVLPDRPGLRKRLLPKQIPAPAPGVDDGETGKWVTSGWGIYAASETETGISLSDGVWLYAPTHMPANGACLEIVTVHRNPTGAPGMEHTWGVYDHCTANAFIRWENMDSTWLSKYRRTIGGQDVYYSQVSRSDATPDCFYTDIYNFTNAVWETRDTVCGSSGWTNGWTMWEYNDFGTACPSITDITAKDILIQTSLFGSGVWFDLLTSQTSPLTTSGDCFDDGDYTFTFSTKTWTADTTP